MEYFIERITFPLFLLCGIVYSLPFFYDTIQEIKHGLKHGYHQDVFKNIAQFVFYVTVEITLCLMVIDLILNVQS